MNSKVFTEFLTNHFGSEAPGLAIVSGFITATATSAALLLLSYGELKTMISKSLRTESKSSHR